MNDTDVQATNTDYKPKLHKNNKLVLQIWLVNNNVVTGSTKILIQEHVALGQIRFYVLATDLHRGKLMAFLLCYCICRKGGQQGGIWRNSGIHQLEPEMPVNSALGTAVPACQWQPKT